MSYCSRNFLVSLKCKFDIPDSQFSDEFSRKKRGIPWLRQPKTVRLAPFRVDCKKKQKQMPISLYNLHLLPLCWWANTDHDYLRPYFLSSHEIVYFDTNKSSEAAFPLSAKRSLMKMSSVSLLKASIIQYHPEEFFRCYDAYANGKWLVLQGGETIRLCVKLGTAWV